MNMKPIDKKQIPQFAALCVVSAGVFGYLVVHLVAPGTASAGTRPAAAPIRPGAPTHPGAPARPAVPASAASAASAPSASGAAAGASAAGASAASTDIPDAPPPSPMMHDPFAVGYVDPATTASAAALAPVKAPALPKLPAPGKKIASLGTAPLPAGPRVPALPSSLSPFPVRLSAPAPSAESLPVAPAAPALPAAPAPPSWTVTGVLQGATEKVAILRSGEARRIVRAGDFVDGTYRVAGVTRTSVVLRHGMFVYQLPLGGAKAEPAKPAAPAMPAPAAPLPMPRSAAVLDGTLMPLYHAAPVHSPLAPLKHQEQELGLAAAMPSVPSSAAPAKVAASISLGLRLLDGSVLAQGRKE